jgi:hypothetical protein
MLKPHMAHKTLVRNWECSSDDLDAVNQAFVQWENDHPMMIPTTSNLSKNDNDEWVMTWETVEHLVFPVVTLEDD